jgi:hypothetical protein
METSIKDQLLAMELAEALNDTDSILFFLKAVREFPESVLREKLAKALAVPADKAPNRARLFNYFLQQHAQKTRMYPRH